MEPRQEPRTPEQRQEAATPRPEEPKRFQIERLEERIAPSKHKGGGGYGIPIGGGGL
jgi:hypothetical protein